MDNKTVVVSHEWFHDVVRFIACFTSGNSIPSDIVFNAKRYGKAWIKHATRLRDTLPTTKGQSDK